MNALCLNTTPRYIGTTGGKHSYQASNGCALPLDDVPNFYDRGIALTKVECDPASGQYSINAVTGIVTIGGTKPGLPTCDVSGLAEG